jgi:tRNA A-37 threonylcarbamoyl transferase component Bud32
MKKIGIGRTAEVYDYKDNKVLKLFYSTFNDKDIEYEYLITKNISDTTSIAPKVYDVINVNNRMGIVYEKINGQMLSEYLSRNFKNAHKIVHKFAQTQKVINNINSENIPNHTNKLKQRITNSSLLCDSEKEIIVKYLKTINKNEICHGDYHPENVFVDQNYNFRVIDWANMFVSNKYIDIARTYYLIKLGKSLNRKTKPGELIEWLGRQFITKLYWEKIKTEENRRKYFLPCLFIVILIRYDENIEREGKWIHNYVMKNKKKMLMNMDIKKHKLTKGQCRLE